MATQTHQLNIKAKLDTSEVRAELERLNQNRGAGTGAGGAQGQGTAQRTTQLLSKLDGTLNKLNTTLQNLAAAFKQGGMPGGSGNRSPSQSTSQNGFIPLSLAEAVRQMDRLFPKMMAKAGASAGLTEQELQVLKFRGILSDSTVAKISAAKKAQPLNPPKAQPLNPPIVSQNVMRVFPDGSYELVDRDEAPQQNQKPNWLQKSVKWIQNKWQHGDAIKKPLHWMQSQLNREIMSPATARKWRNRMQSGFLGHQIATMGAQIGQLAGGEETSWGRFIGGAGNVFNAGAMGFMINPLIGALTAASQAAMEFAKEVVRARMELLQNETKVIAGVAEANRTRWLDLAETNVLGEDTELQEQQAQARLTKARDRRSNLLDEMARGPSPSFDAETRAEIMSGWQAQLKDLDQEIKLNKEVLDTIQRRKTVLNNEIEANQKLAQAEREFAESIRRNEEAERSRYYSSSEKNVQANREALRNYRQQLTGARASQMMAVFNTGIESQLGQIHTNTFNGNKDPAYWYKLAREQRSYIGQFQQLALGTGDLQKMAEYMRKASEASQKFSGFMQMAQALKIMQIGQPVDRVDLQSLTSLAGRGGWMGEQYRQPEYMSTLDKMYDTLKSIDDNTRAAEKSVWQ